MGSHADFSYLILYHHVATSVDLAGKDVLEVSCGRGGGASYTDGYLPVRDNTISIDTSRLKQISINEQDMYVTAEVGVAPTHIKIDVEGAETRVLEGATEVLKRVQPTLFLSTHGPEVHNDCCRLLREYGYELEPINSAVPSLRATQRVIRRRASSTAPAAK